MKASLALTLLLLGVFVLLNNAAAQISASDQQAMVDAHNAARSAASPQASNMAKIVWDDSLAASAQKYAESCPSDHSGASGLGENLAWTWSQKTTGPEAVQLWVDEKQHYNYNTGQCAAGQQCGHYTQIMWAKTTKMGCGYKFCSQGAHGRPNSHTFVCQYSPQGNFVGEKPYKAGNPCSECSNGSQCSNNLCTGGGSSTDSGSSPASDSTASQNPQQQNEQQSQQQSGQSQQQPPQQPSQQQSGQSQPEQTQQQPNQESQQSPYQPHQSSQTQQNPPSPQQTPQQPNRPQQPQPQTPHQSTSQQSQDQHSQNQQHQPHSTQNSQQTPPQDSTQQEHQNSPQDQTGASGQQAFQQHTNSGQPQAPGSNSSAAEPSNHPSVTSMPPKNEPRTEQSAARSQLECSTPNPASG